MRFSARACIPLLLLLTTGGVVLSPVRLSGAGQAATDIPGPTIRVSTRLVLVDVVARCQKCFPRASEVGCVG